MNGRIKHSMVSPEELESVDESSLDEFGPAGKVNELDPFPGEAKDKKELDNLFMLGFVEGEKKIGSFTFKLRTLTNSENQKVINLLNNSDNAFDAQDIMLAYSIISVNDVALEDRYEGEDGDKLDPIRKKLHVIKNLQSQLVNDLVKYYNSLVAESNKEISEEDLKK